jgi:hypothetical protein
MEQAGYDDVQGVGRLILRHHHLTSLVLTCFHALRKLRKLLSIEAAKNADLREELLSAHRFALAGAEQPDSGQPFLLIRRHPRPQGTVMKQLAYSTSHIGECRDHARVQRLTLPM